MLSGKKGFSSKMSSSRLGVLVNNTRGCVVCSAARLWFYMHLSFETHLGRVLASTNGFHLSAAAARRDQTRCRCRMVVAEPTSRFKHMHGLPAASADQQAKAIIPA